MRKVELDQVSEGVGVVGQPTASLPQIPVDAILELVGQHLRRRARRRRKRSDCYHSFLFDMMGPQKHPLEEEEKKKKERLLPFIPLRYDGPPPESPPSMYPV